MAEAQSISWEPPSLEDLQRLLPHYEIVGLIGRSGMGAVYRGRQTRLGRDLASGGSGASATARGRAGMPGNS